MSESLKPVALVTGSATGVGRACVLEFAKRGYAVVINYSRSEAEAKQTAEDVESFGAESLVVRADVSSDQQVREMAKQIEAKFGRLDILVNNAATTSFVAHEDLEGLTEEMWDRMLAVNLKGAFFVTRSVSKLLQADDGGSVVNVSSIAGIVGAGSSIAYCTSKAGLNVMTKSLARVMAPKVTVNSVCPGPIDSRWIREGNPSWDLEAMVADYPIPKASQPEDVADAVLFFAINASMVTGQILTVDGGMTL